MPNELPKRDLIPVDELKAHGFQLMSDTDPRRFGYPQHWDIFEVLWYELRKAARLMNQPVQS